MRILLRMNVVHIMKKAIMTKEKILENAKKEARSKGYEGKILGILSGPGHSLQLFP